MKKFLIDSSKTGLMRTALVENGQLVELIVDENNGKPYTGDIYIARVEKVLKKQYAFVNIGTDKNGFLQLNEKMNIQQGQAIIVQVEKEAYAEKGCALTLNLSLAGKYATITANDNKPIGISRKITDEKRRNELLSIAKNALNGTDFCCVMRTNSEFANNDEIITEISLLSAKISKIIENGQYCKPPFRLYSHQKENEKLLQDCFNDGDEIIINDSEYHKNLSLLYPDAQFYSDVLPLFMHYGIENKIAKLLHNKIWLDCGGFLVFNYTEAMTVIDVNTGKFTNSKNMRQTILKTNLQAAKEIAVQLRLRNLSGIIIVDFVNMRHKEDIEQLEQTIRAEIFKDRIKTLYVGMTELGLVQITRKKERKPLHMILTAPCKGCNGIGLVRSHRYLCDLIKNDIISIFTQTIYQTAVVSSNNTVITSFKNSGIYDELQAKYNKKIVCKIIDTAREDYFEVNYQ